MGRRNFLVLAVAKPHLGTESIRVARWVEANWHARRGRNAARSWNNYQTTTGNVYVGYLLNGCISISARKVLPALVIQSPAVPRTESPPTGRINLSADDELNRVVLECVGRSAANVLRRAKFANALEPLIDREIDADTPNYLIGTIQQSNTIGTLRITVQPVSEVRGQVDMLAQPGVGEHGQTKVTNVPTRARAALQLIKALRVVSFIPIPTVHWNEAETERIPRPGNAPLGAAH